MITYFLIIIKTILLSFMHLSQMYLEYKSQILLMQLCFRSSTIFIINFTFKYYEIKFLTTNPDYQL